MKDSSKGPAEVLAKHLFQDSSKGPAEGLAKHFRNDLVKHLESLSDRNSRNDSNASYVANENVRDSPPELLLLKQLNRLKTESAKSAQTAAESCR